MFASSPPVIPYKGRDAGQARSGSIANLLTEAGQGRCRAPPSRLLRQPTDFDELQAKRLGQHSVECGLIGQHARSARYRRLLPVPRGRGTRSGASGRVGRGPGSGTPAAWALGACPSKEGSPVIRILAVTLPSGGASGNHPAGVIPARTASRAARSACPREAPRFVRPNKNGDFAVGNSRSATGHRFM